MSILDALFTTPDYMRQPPAYFHSRILVGAGAMLRPRFVARHNITHVINCAFDYDSPEWWRKGFPTKYTELHAIDSLTTNILYWYPAFEETLRRYLREGDGVVYVHCQAGMNRSGFLALAYCCAKFNMDMDALIRDVKRQRPVILQNQVFMTQVKEFVNGRVQGSKAEGDKRGGSSNRDTRFLTPRSRSDSMGVEVNAGEFEGREDDDWIGDHELVFEK
jgi:hypothetical protein